MKKQILLLTMSIFSTFPAFAAEVETETTNTVKSWYFNLGLGYAFPNYDTNISKAVNSMKNAGASQTPLALDLGVYGTLPNQKTIIGGVINGVSDSYSLNGSTVSITQGGLYFSVIHSLMGEPGEGLFVRGDVGLAAVMSKVETPLITLASETDTGIGLLGGLGYGFNVGKGSRILANLNYSYRSVGGNKQTKNDTYGATVLSATILF